MISSIKNRIITESFTIIQALKKMDEVGKKLLFIFEKDKFKGIITVGDIQRAIINGIPLDGKISCIIDENKIYAKEGESRDVIKAKMSSLRAECMPVISSNGDLINVLFWEDIFSSGQIQSRAKINLPIIIMAGGLGTRLRPITNVIPKPLIPINNKTIIEIIMDQFQRIGCSKFYLSVNYKYDVIKYYLDNLTVCYDIEYFKEDKPLGTIGSLSLLDGKLKTPFFVSNCDILIDQDYRDVYEYHLSNSNDLTIVTSLKTYNIPYGVVETVENGVLRNITEKPDMTYMINTGVYILNPELIKLIPKGRFFNITQLIDKVKNSGGRIGCFPVSEKSWTDIGDWDEYLKLIKNLNGK